MIRIIGVSKRFRIYEDRSRDLKETAINLLRGKKRSFREIWALREIYLDIHEGETVALIGENGSGKSTLLKLLAGIYTPDKGKIILDGKVSTLLELGVGFHPDLTGEENIYLNGAMLGFDKKTMKEKFEEIVSFSEIGNFIYSPIRTYSSGMLMRLGFSIATSVESDTLLVDEILAVGDEAFQEKCLNRMREFKKAGKTIILVTHNLELVKIFCDRAVLLCEGRMAYDGPPEETIEAYHNYLLSKSEYPIMQKEIENRKGVEKEATGPPMVDEGADEVEFHPERLRVIEVEDAEFFAGCLFREAFGHPPPPWPHNYVAVYSDIKDPSILHLVGFIHIQRIGEGIGLIGGICIAPRWQARGLEKEILDSIDRIKEDDRVFFIYTDNPVFALKCGYEPLFHPYLMVKWLVSLPPEEKARLIDKAIAFGPF